jgi:hypothetical protein
MCTPRQPFSVVASEEKWPFASSAVSGSLPAKFAFASTQYAKGGHGMPLEAASLPSSAEILGTVSES